MAMGLRKQIGLIDPKQCFDLWGQGISVYRIPLLLKEKYGQYNENTGKPFSHQGVFMAAGKYIVEHFSEPEVREVFNNVWKSNGIIATDKDWYKFVLEKATYLSKSKYKEWIEKYSYLKPYLEND